MAATKRPSKGTDRPMLRTSHGTPRQRPSAARPEAEGRARPAPKGKPARPAAAPAARKRAVLPRPEPEAKESVRRDDDVAKPAKKARTVLSGSTASDESREVAIAIAVAGLEKKASGLEVIDVAGRVDYADFLVLMSGRSDRHVAALAAGIEESLRKRNKRALAVEGLPHATWVLMDFGDVVVHVFQDDARAIYDLDGLWMDARRLPVPLPDMGR